MKSYYKLISYVLFLGWMVVGCTQQSTVPKDLLKEGFVTPDDSITTSVYWYWLAGNISKEGVVKDLESMKAAGINRAFIGNISPDPRDVPVGKVKLFSDEWFDITHAALKRAGELGIDIGMFNCPGWSQAGGPWTTPNHAMRYLTSTKTIVDGGRQIQLRLPKPAGAFQDVRVIAFPFEQESLKKQLFSPIKLEGKGDSSVVSLNTKELFTLRNLTIYTAHQNTRADADFQVKEGASYRSLVQFKIDRTNDALNVGFDPYAPISISVPKTEGKQFRLVLTKIATNSALDKIEFSSLPKVERYAEKTLAKMCQTPFPYWHEYQWRTQPTSKDAGLEIDPKQIIDVSSSLHGDQFTWNAPKGKWVVMRCGMLPTGTENGPAADNGRGLEVDKMTDAYLQEHFDAFLGRVMKRIPAEDRKSLKISVNDSYEVGGQNFTDSFFVDFKRAYGYDALPFLPVFSGMVVQSEEVSDRFLWDVRRLVADQLAYKHVGGMRKIAHKHGLTTWLENYGHWGFPGEFLNYGGQSDEVGGEFWSEGALGNIENRAASSCAHIYGKQRVSAESFTCGGAAYSRYPANMKPRGDRFFSEGINNTLLHVYISQSTDSIVPGLNAPWSNEFNRKNTWFSQLDLFTAYLKRTNYMLQQGLNIADVAYFIGEDTPKMTGITDPALPKGYQYDYINGEIILHKLFVKDGLLTLPHGTQYKMLVLPPLETMRPELLSKIKQLIEDGAVVLGSAPLRSPSLSHYPQADAQVKALADSLWGKIVGDQHYAKIGKGMIMQGLDMKDALALINLRPDFEVPNNVPMLYAHRKTKQADIYFITNQSDSTLAITPKFRVTGMLPELWSATNGATRSLVAYSFEKDNTEVPLKLAPYESAFIVFRTPAKQGLSGGVEINFPQTTILTTLLHWKLQLDPAFRGPIKPLTLDSLIDLSTSTDNNVKYYSGTMHYTSLFVLPKHNNKMPLYLDLGKVGMMAKVKINDKYVGGVWTAPYCINISKFVVAGTNTVDIEVVNTWINRLIGDEHLPQSERRTWCPNNPWKANDPLQVSGLIGPVTITSP